jgi:cytochrome c biogenesis protein CcdA
MALLVLSFVAGVLTVAAPCILPLLPVIVGGSLLNKSEEAPEKRWVRPLIIAISLAISVIAFTLLLKATTALLGIPQSVWQILSGIIVTSMGLYYLWPKVWESVAFKGGFMIKSNAVLTKANRVNGWTGPTLIGASLGPVFNSCSPTYALIVATILPVSLASGLLYLIAYALGMSLTLLVVAYAGQAATAKLRFAANPSGWFRRGIGLLFIIVGLSVIFGLDKRFQTFVLERGWYDPVSSIERRLAE